MATDPVVVDHFNNVAAEYETNLLGAWYIAHGRFIASHLGNARFQAVLDIGCGTGWLLRELSRSGVAAHGIGLDLSPNMLLQARKLAGAENDGLLEFAQCDWPEVGPALLAKLQAMAPDLIICASSLHYFADVDAALQQAYRVLRPGGRILILERAPELSLLTRLWGHAHRWILRDGVEFHDTRNVMEKMRRSGFTAVSIMDTLRKYFWEGKMVTSLALIGGQKPAQDRQQTE